MHQHSRERLRAEIGDTEEALVSVTGQRPTGFRGPGFSWSPDLLEVLTERGYRYDASTLPTFIGPAARLYFLATARLTPSERKQRQALFGSVGEGFRPSGAYMPFFRLTETTWSMPGLAPPGKTIISVDFGCETSDPIWSMKGSFE